MYCCFVCKYTCERINDIHNHIKRHRKTEMIDAMLKLPTAKVNSNDQADMEVNKADMSNNDRCDTCLEPEDMNNNMRKGKNHQIRRSGRLREVNNHQQQLLKTTTFLSQQEEQELPHFTASIENNYYIPNVLQSPPGASQCSDDSNADVVLQNVKCHTKQCDLEEPLLTTPKCEKGNNSDTDSCSGNALSAPTSERFFCKFCGSGYRTDSMLADHIRYKHLNFCALCKVNFADADHYKHHVRKHLLHVFICPYCTAEFKEREPLMLHMERHMQAAAVDDVLSLEAEYCSERNYMNAMYNMFNAGFRYGRRTTVAPAAASSTRSYMPANKMPIEFYKAFLQHATCGAGGTDKDYTYIAHGSTSACATDVERIGGLQD